MGLRFYFYLSGVLFLLFSNTTLYALKKNGARDILVILSDLDKRDFYLGRLKGLALNIHPKIHFYEGARVKPFEEARLAKIATIISGDYPKGSVFLFAINPLENKRPLLLKTLKGQFFLAPDTGILSRLIEKYGVLELRELTNPKFFRYAQKLNRGSEMVFDVLLPAAALICRGIFPDRMGQKTISLKKIPIEKARNTRTGIRGKVELIDNSGRLLTNIKGTHLEYFELKFGDVLPVNLEKRLLLFSLVKDLSKVPSGTLAAHLDHLDNLVLELHRSNLIEKYDLKIKDGDTLYIPLNGY
ncbi:SAM-dependent chlorinase/fluorinase [Candidatus Riflebacteria bacterium]